MSNVPFKITCPECMGHGDYMDGSASFSGSEDGTVDVKSVPATECRRCKGKGTLRVLEVE